MARLNKDRLKVGQIASYIGLDNKRYEAPIVTLLSVQCRLLSGMMVLYSDIASVRDAEVNEEFIKSQSLPDRINVKYYKFINEEWILEKTTNVPHSLKSKKR